MVLTALQCYCGDNEYKIRTSFKILVSKDAVTWRLQQTSGMYKKQCLPVITRNRKHSPKQVVSMIYTLGKDFFATATFQGF